MPERTWPAVVLIAGILLAGLGQFGLEGLADSNDAWHWLQHGALCLGGVVLGMGATLLYSADQRRR